MGLLNNPSDGAGGELTKIEADVRYRARHEDVPAADVSGLDALVSALVAAVVDAAPEALDTLNELAAALGNDPDFATTILTEVGARLRATDLDSLAKLEALIGVSLAAVIAPNGTPVQTYIKPDVSGRILATWADVTPEAIGAYPDEALFLVENNLGDGNASAFGRAVYQKLTNGLGAVAVFKGLALLEGTGTDLSGIGANKIIGTDLAGNPVGYDLGKVPEPTPADDGKAVFADGQNGYVLQVVRQLGIPTNLPDGVSPVAKNGQWVNGRAKSVIQVASRPDTPEEDVDYEIANEDHARMYMSSSLQEWRYTDGTSAETHLFRFPAFGAGDVGTQITAIAPVDGSPVTLTAGATPANNVIAQKVVQGTTRYLYAVEATRGINIEETALDALMRAETVVDIANRFVYFDVLHDVASGAYLRLRLDSAVTGDVPRGGQILRYHDGTSEVDLFAHNPPVGTPGLLAQLVKTAITVRSNGGVIDLIKVTISGETWGDAPAHSFTFVPPNGLPALEAAADLDARIVASNNSTHIQAVSIIAR